MTESEKLYDYYYSAKQSAVVYKLGQKVETKVRGQKYTEAVPTGLKPLGNFDDLICVARGVSMRECSFK